MADAEKQTKTVDNWRKLEVIGKIFSGVVLVVITIIINSGATKIQHAVQKGRLIESLIDDLTDENQTSQDIALIALNWTVEKKDSLLVLQIAEQIWKKRPGKDEISAVAREIIAEQDSAKADSLLLEIGQETRRSPVDMLSQPGDQPEGYTNSLLDDLPKVAYIQFRGSLTRSEIDELRTLLKAKDIPSPRAERLGGDYNNSIRYFHEEDEELAQLVDRVATAFFEEKGCSIGDIPVNNLESKGFRVPRGQVELWIQGSCPD